MAMTFVILRNQKGEFYFKLLDADVKTMLMSEGYTAKSSCKNGIESVRKNASIEGKLVQLAAKDGRPYLNLKAGNGQIVGTSPMFANEEAVAAAIKMIKRNAYKAKVVDRS